MSEGLPSIEEGEASMLRNMEKKRGSRALAAAGGTIYDALKDTQQNVSALVTKPKPKFSRLVRKIMTEKQHVESGVAPPSHTRTKSNAQVYNLLLSMKEADKSEPVLDDVFQQDIFHPEESAPPTPELSTDDLLGLGGGSGDDGDEEPASGGDEEQPEAVDSTPLLPNDGEVAARRWKELHRGRRCCSGSSIKAFFWGILCHCWLLIFAALLAGLAWILYYSFGNPKVDAIPGNASLSWWCNWFARQFVLFEAARVIKFILLDCIILGSNFTVKLVGSFVTLMALQAKNWPFILMVWGLLNACVLQGDNAFQNHWLYFTGWQIYSMKANSGLHIISSERYLRLLLCMIVTGAATTLKRTFVAISFGRRQYSSFKPRLEKLLLEVVLLNEVANLSVHAESMADEISTASSQPESQEPKGSKKNPRKKLTDVTWDSVKMKPGEMGGDENEGGEETEVKYGRVGSSMSNASFLKQLLDRWEEPAVLDKVSPLDE